MPHNTENLNIASADVLMNPSQIKSDLPLTKQLEDSVTQHRKTIQNILSGKDKRMFVVVGPCSIHDLKSAHEYAQKLKTLADKVSDSLFIVMRVYFEKPRTTTGWKGLINDPYLNDTFEIETGLKTARQLMIELATLSLPIATEALDPISPQYLADLISWSAIGARTTESQTHREMASGLSSPVGFKNGTDGSLKVAIDALQAVSHPHNFLGINSQGQVAVISTKGNQFGHVVLRGGGGKPNYESSFLKECEQQLIEKNLTPNIVVDCSHENSSKDHNKQAQVFEYCIQQRLKGNKSIIGMMLESHLHSGNQKIPKDLNDLAYGVSITDACIDWNTTEDLILKSAAALANN